jgi:hypothetical protein
MHERSSLQPEISANSSAWRGTAVAKIDYMNNRASRKLHRREVLAALGGSVGAVAIAACGSSSTSPYHSEYSQPGFNGTGQTFMRGARTEHADDRRERQRVLGRRDQRTGHGVGQRGRGYTAMLNVGIQV